MSKPQERDDTDVGTFLWEDLVAASGEELENGQFRGIAEIIERLALVADGSLVAALQDTDREVRVTCCICTEVARLARASDNKMVDPKSLCCGS